jgi:hypothetical protein
MERREFLAAILVAAAALKFRRAAADDKPPDKLNPKSRAESDARYRRVLEKWGKRFSDGEKRDLQRYSDELQGVLDALRGLEP